MKSLAAGLALVLAAPAAAQAPPGSGVAAGAAFDRLKALAGEWEGTVTKPDGPKASVVYRVTAHGTVVVETLFPGTSHEMVTMYHRDGAELLATHYCAMGNQPRMRLEKGSDARELRFAFAGGTNLDPAKDAHMNSGRIAFLDADRFEAEWDVYEGGKPTGKNRFFMARKRP